MQETKQERQMQEREREEKNERKLGTNPQH